nr:glycine-rich cell wall structural protein 1.8 [Ipomoea batatas]
MVRYSSDTTVGLLGPGSLRPSVSSAIVFSSHPSIAHASVPASTLNLILPPVALYIPATSDASQCYASLKVAWANIVCSLNCPGWLLCSGLFCSAVLLLSAPFGSLAHSGLNSLATGLLLSLQLRLFTVSIFLVEIKNCRNIWFEAATVVAVAPPVEIPAGSVLKSALAGGLACALSTSLMHPIDTIKGVNLTFRVEKTYHVSMISITLSEKELNKNSPGYQAPSHVEQGQQYNNNYLSQQPYRHSHEVYSNDNEDSCGQGNGCGRGKGCGLNIGGYGNYQGNCQGNLDTVSQNSHEERLWTQF